MTARPEVAAPVRRRPRLRRALVRQRRLVTALLVGTAVTAALSAVAPAPPRLATVAVAVRDLPGGWVLSAADVTLARVPPDAVPGGAFPDASAVLGRTLAAAVRRGEPLTDVRLLGPGLLAGTSGLVAVPARLADAGSAAMVEPGDLVDVLAAAAVDPVGSGLPPTTAQTAADPATAMVVAESARVLAVPASGSGPALDGALVVLAVPPAAARRLAVAQATARLSLALRPGPGDLR